MRRLFVLIKNILSIPNKLFLHISIFSIIQESKIDKKAAICSGVRFYRSSIGKYSYVGGNSFIIDTEIGNFTSIAPECYIGGTGHPLDWVSTSPVFHKWDNILKKNFASHEFEIFRRTTIGNDVWIGSRSMIKAGITIADGAVVGMGSIVTKNIGPYEVWAGNPAKLILKRYDSDEMIRQISDTKWWNWKDEDIGQYANVFTDKHAFLERFVNEKRS